MRIAIVIDIYQDKGNGTSISARQLVSELRAKGHFVRVLCTKSYDQTKETQDIVEFPVKVIPGFQKMIESQHAVLAEPDDAMIRKAFADIDIVHIYMPFFLGTRCAKLASEMNIPVLGCYHISAENITFNAGMRYVPFATETAYKFLRNHHYKSDIIKDIHCPSRCIASTVFKYHYQQNLHIVSNGYNPEFRVLDEPKTIGKFLGKIVITSVGRLTEEKRQDLIIKAVAKSKYKDKIVVVLAGKGPKKDWLQKLADKHGVCLDFVFLSREELINLHNQSYLFVQASDVETESISCLESIACGTVPIISDARMCATKQFSLSKKSLFKKGSAISLRNKIDYWIKNKEKHDLIQTEYANFAKKFSLEKSVCSMIMVYRSLLEDKNTYTIRDYNNPLSLTVQVDENGKPKRAYRPFLHQMYRLLKSYR